MRNFLNLWSQNIIIMKVTLNDIAIKCGVSTTTVSRVLCGKSKIYRISQITAAKVLKEAGRCCYTSHSSAQNLRNKKSNTIALLVPSVSNPFFAEIASAIISQAYANNFTTIVIDTMENEDNEIDAIRKMILRKVDGIIVAPCCKEPFFLQKVNREKTPVVLIDRYYEGTDLPYVTTNNYTGGFDGTQYLISQGHKKIACIQGVSSSIPNQKRVEGYIDCMKKAGLEKNILVVGNDFSTQNGYIETKLLLSGDACPSAIFSLSSTINLGALKAIREAGLNIPQDISVMSFDDNIYLDYMTPPITRIGQSVADMVSISIKILLESINKVKGYSGISHIKLAPRLIVRQSVGYKEPQ